jgi:LysM repeat protein
MRKIAFGLLIFTLAAGGVRAQDAATQQELDKLGGQLQDIVDGQAAQSKRLDTMEQEISELRDKVSATPTTTGASADDLQKLAEQVKEIDQKRQDDKTLILEKIGEVTKLMASTPTYHHIDSDPGVCSGPTPAPTRPQKGYPYKVQAGDSLSAIVKAFREKGVKVTLAQVLKANPGLTANTLYVDKTIFIPDASAK